MSRRKIPVGVEKILDRAFDLRNAGHTPAALDLLETIRSKAKQVGMFHFVRAMFAFEIDDYAGAARDARRSIALNTQARRASEILFHALFDLGRRDEAFREMRRFLQVRESKIFRRLLRDLTKDLPRIHGRDAKWLRNWLEKMPPVRKNRDARDREEKKKRPGKSRTAS